MLIKKYYVVVFEHDYFIGDKNTYKIFDCLKDAYSYYKSYKETDYDDHYTRISKPFYKYTFVKDVAVKHGLVIGYRPVKEDNYVETMIPIDIKEVHVNTFQEFNNTFDTEDIIF